MPQTDASLATALETLRERGLGLRRGSEAPMLERARPSVPTGHPSLDAALGTDGWPRGALALLDAPLGSGASTLALGTLAAVQAAGGLTAWLDLDGTLDPAVAARLGVSLEWLLVVRPRDPAEAIELAAWLGRSGLIDAFVLDLGAWATPERRALDRLASLLARSGSTSALVLAPAGRTVAGVVAGVRVALHRTAWLGIGRDLVGQRVQAVVERHRWALVGGAAELDLWFGEGRRIEPLVASLARPQLLEERPALVLAPAGRTVAGVVAGVRVALHRTAWLGIGRDLVGQRVQAVVERHRWALIGGAAELDLWFGEGRRIDPFVASLARPQLLEERPALRVVSA